MMMPNLHMMARLRTGQPLGPVQLVEEAQDARLTPSSNASWTADSSGCRRLT
ncbi:luciferase family monooxygenase domain protein [Mycobacterium ulcerans str. Harvey]|uniref:Luciferase family monooxygenase domain protein n=1 Tax=Mycobacterium ulcerans str. Harvey TaxID=1299332 RepID=A0ABN0QN59_MYCUL|nr:luciferase family monooxygenase domain protein [Mycobacterium ulcerans str. Harvey]